MRKHQKFQENARQAYFYVMNALAVRCVVFVDAEYFFMMFITDFLSTTFAYPLIICW